MQHTTPRIGYAYAIAAHTMWGLLPAYWKMLAEVPSLEVIAHRVIWSLLFLVSVCVANRALGDILTVIRAPGSLLTLMVTGSLIASNWLVYVWAVNHNQITEASLGYFISPLFTIALGALLFRENLSSSKKAAIALASGAVLLRMTSQGVFPWVGIVLAVTLSLYGFLRKRLAVSSLTGLFLETLLLAPLAVTYLAANMARGMSHFSVSQPSLMMLLVLTGIATSLPLLCFVRAGQLLPLSTLGILQYTSPSLQFLSAIVLFREPLSGASLVSFSLIWLAIVLYLVGERLGRKSPGTCKEVT